MTKNYVKKLASASFTKGKLNKKKVTRITKYLKRKDLKVYIKNLKAMEGRQTVIITVPDDKGLNEKRKYFSNIYSVKKLVFTIDTSLLTGIRVVDVDNEYELSLKNFLENGLKGLTND